MQQLHSAPSHAAVRCASAGLGGRREQRQHVPAAVCHAVATSAALRSRRQACRISHAQAQIKAGTAARPVRLQICASRSQLAPTWQGSAAQLQVVSFWTVAMHRRRSPHLRRRSPRRLCSPRLLRGLLRRHQRRQSQLQRRHRQSRHRRSQLRRRRRPPRRRSRRRHGPRRRRAPPTPTRILSGAAGSSAPSQASTRTGWPLQRPNA